MSHLGHSLDIDSTIIWKELSVQDKEREILLRSSSSSDLTLWKKNSVGSPGHLAVALLIFPALDETEENAVETVEGDNFHAFLFNRPYC
ncbi:Protein of unknown function [Pyronema omphalodes CBS 100304]|uniref:Uncharacterized protein n=1 Tax=Pyronema omphalodes (strain CBS 100304) TaxID=1076935 RepID=U4LF47_PYROM|nr:Protein of unknown function [Pyronema omphalodes CBS 100304]